MHVSAGRQRPQPKDRLDGRVADGVLDFGRLHVNPKALRRAEVKQLASAEGKASRSIALAAG